MVQADTADTIDITVIRLLHMSNFADFDSLQREVGVSVRYVNSVDALGYPDAIILPGSRGTFSDLKYLWQSGLAEGIVQRAKSGMPVVGICGGFEMLGREIKDGRGVKLGKDVVAGLGLLDISTVFKRPKTTCRVRARVLCNEGLIEGLGGEEVTGYENHLGQTTGNNALPLLLITQRVDGQTDYVDGAVANGGLTFGSFLHGLFNNTNFCRVFLSRLRQRKRN